MREEKSRRDQFSHGPVSNMLPPGVVSGKQSSLLLQEQDSAASVSIDLEPAMGQLSIQRAVYDDSVSEYCAAMVIFFMREPCIYRTILCLGLLPAISGGNYAKYRIYYS